MEQFDLICNKQFDLICNNFFKLFFLKIGRSSPLTTSHLSSSSDLSKIPLRFWQKALLVLNWELLLFIIFLAVAWISREVQVIRISRRPASS